MELIKCRGGGRELILFSNLKSRKTRDSFFIFKVGELEHVGGTPCIRVLEKMVAVELGAS